MSAIHALSQLSYGPSKQCHGTTGLTGLEPATSGVTDRHSNQLSYSPPTKQNTFLAPQYGAYWTRTSDLYDVNVAL